MQSLIKLLVLVMLIAPLACEEESGGSKTKSSKRVQRDENRPGVIPSGGIIGSLVSPGIQVTSDTSDTSDSSDIESAEPPQNTNPVNPPGNPGFFIPSDTALTPYCKEEGTEKERICFETCSVYAQEGTEAPGFLDFFTNKIEELFGSVTTALSTARTLLTVMIDQATSVHIKVRDRESGRISVQKMNSDAQKAISSVYGKDFALDNFASRSIIQTLLEEFTQHYKGLYENPSDAEEQICSFIQEFQININEASKPINEYNTMNEFFYRHLAASAREVDADPFSLTSPADSTVVTYDTVGTASDFWIKGENFSLEELLAEDSEWTETYKNPSLAIVRLAPQHYHRFHMPVDGIIGRSKVVPGELYSVNPMAIANPHVSVLSENVRVITEMNNEHIGDFLFISIGASIVGSVNITQQERNLARKGDEFGFFAYGGSTLVLVFPEGSILFDDDLIEYSSLDEPIESSVLVGEKIGTITSRNLGIPAEGYEATLAAEDEAKADATATSEETSEDTSTESTESTETETSVETSEDTQQYVLCSVVHLDDNPVACKPVETGCGNDLQGHTIDAAGEHDDDAVFANADTCLAACNALEFTDDPNASFVEESTGVGDQFAACQDIIDE